MRFLIAMIGYAAVATVLSALLGLGYLWQTERLTDERLFRIVALLHGVDLNESIEDEQPMETIPDEEMSIVEKERLAEIKTRNHEAHLFSLQRGRNEFEHSLSQLVSERDRFDSMARELQKRLEQESAETAHEGVKNVVRDLTLAKPDQGKQMLLRMLNRGGGDPIEKQRALDDVIRLINAMPRDTWEEIQKRFEGQVELDQLHVIQLEQLNGGAKKRVYDKALRQLRNRG
ncbi:hypothetical protein MalM25_26930 [Planctomycetes bacterium MalM25]|nr:hypothetical protein MalM25_26930 [Planctomycetes bacterium MalM25]